MKKSFKTLSERRLELEGRKHPLESELADFLLKKRDLFRREIEELQRVNHSGTQQTTVSSQSLAELLGQQEALAKELEAQNDELDEVREKIAELTAGASAAKKNFDKSRKERRLLDKKIENQQTSINHVLQLITGLESEVNQFTAKSAEFGLINETFLKEYGQLSERKLEAELEKVCHFL